MATASKSGTNISYTYDITGIRDSKTVNGTTYNYISQNGQVVRQTWPGHTMDFVYDEQNRPRALIYDGTTYRYVLNQQGDVIGIVNTTNGATAAKYAYDAWGNMISGSGSLSAVNPLRYRGYYYDTETGFYYLGSRYYDPAIKRFINADVFESVFADGSFAGKNLFAYCQNRPTIADDRDGYLPTVVIGAIVGGILGGIEAGFNNRKQDDPKVLAQEIAKGAIKGMVTGAIGAIPGSTLGCTLVGAALGAYDEFDYAKKDYNANKISKSGVVARVLAGAVVGGLFGAAGAGDKKESLSTLRTFGKDIDTLWNPSSVTKKVYRDTARKVGRYVKKGFKQIGASLFSGATNVGCSRTLGFVSSRSMSVW